MKPPRHFSRVLGRKAHLSIGRHTRTLCGRDIGSHPVVYGLTAEEAVASCGCLVCKSIVRLNGNEKGR